MTLSTINKTNLFQLLFATMSLSAYYLPLQAQTSQRFKRIDYHYDLISGKVNEVHYQASQPDAFYHKYEYDADNRITKVHTSKDSISWDQDASYTYYAHGPLARVELGDNNVQGMDYAYTLQGWIKGVNSNLLKAENDMGNDGLSGSAHSRVAKDAFGYSLNYHANDYQPIDAAKWSNPALRFEALTPNSDLLAARFDLYNGNISSMVTTIVEPKIYTGGPNQVPNILPQGTAYKYDQLNRLLDMKAFQNLNVAANEWEQGSTYAGLYHNVFKYDANGNILYQERAGQNGLAFDKLTYQYKSGTDGRRVQNRLYHVNDGNLNTTLATDDIEDQRTFIPSPSYPITINDVNNYRYDEIGNLKYDSLEGIAKIEWTVYGKIKRITRFSDNLRSDLEFQYDASGNRVAKIEKPRDANGAKPPSEWIVTYYTRDAQGNVTGIYKHKPLTVGPSFKVIERNVYGSSRLGSDYAEVELISALPAANPSIRVLGAKHFEGSNHLGNVLAVVSDRKIPRDDDGDGVIDYFQSEVLSANDYSPFGVVLDGRSFGVGGRYGFNGMEKDDEVKGEGNSLDFGARVYDSRLGRFMSIDSKTDEFPWISPYAFASNDPVKLIDINGEYPGEKHDRKLERYKSRHQTELAHLNARQIEDKFANSQIKFLGKTVKLRKDTKWYRDWLSLDGQESRSTGFPLSTEKTVSVNQPFSATQISNLDSEVPFNKGTVKPYFNGGASSETPYDVNVKITDGDGNILIDKTYNNLSEDGYINDEIPFSKKTIEVNVTVTAKYSKTGIEDREFAWGVTFTPDNKELSPQENKPNAKPRYDLKK